MRTLSIGKVRGLQACSTPRGALAILALDHRNNLRQALAAAGSGPVGEDDLVAFKRQLVRTLAPAASAVLLDPEYGAAQCIASGALVGQTGLLVALEATGYTGDPVARHSRLLPGWSVAQARRLGASAVKLLVYYHPDAPTAGEIEALLAQVSRDCTEHDLPLFLEPLSYSTDPRRAKLAPDERPQVVLESARRLTAIGADVLKAEFPLEADAQPDEREWAAACAQLTAASAVPWILLSATASYELYLRQVTVALQAGASGVAVGRAVWQEATRLTGVARETFLREQAFERMARLTALCEALARPWSNSLGPPEISAGWYERY
jgi:tagatose 1,6-diphosphate aldolase